MIKRKSKFYYMYDWYKDIYFDHNNFKLAINRFGIGRKLFFDGLFTSTNYIKLICFNVSMQFSVSRTFRTKEECYKFIDDVINNRLIGY